MATLRFVERLRDLVDGVEVVLSDIWGVVHNGLESFPEACAALRSYRDQGGTVILITNAPRPAASVQRQLRKLGVADDTYDAIVSSGDLTRHYVADHPGRKVFWLGPERDTSDRKSTRLNSSHGSISYAVFCLKKKKKKNMREGTKEMTTDIITITE